jgi:hypothetical protein
MIACALNALMWIGLSIAGLFAVLLLGVVGLFAFAAWGVFLNECPGIVEPVYPQPPDSAGSER